MRGERLFVLVSLAFALAGEISCTPCPVGCPSVEADISFAVTDATDGGPVNGVQATLSGPTTVTMTCQVAGKVTICSWPYVPVTVGNYSLDVSAPGFQPVTVQASVKVTKPDPSCACQQGTLKPLALTLNRS